MRTTMLKTPFKPIFGPTIKWTNVRVMSSYSHWTPPPKLPPTYKLLIPKALPKITIPIMNKYWEGEWNSFSKTILVPSQALLFTEHIKFQNQYISKALITWEKKESTSGSPSGMGGGGKGPKKVSFLKELLAGIGGYSRSAILGEPPTGHEFKDEIRSWFDKKLKDVKVPPKFSRQLRNQNYVQDKMGNELPMPAAEMLVELVIKLGETAKEEDMYKTRQAHQDYMVKTIQPFLKGGSSHAPWLMHWLGVFWQEPMIIWDPMTVWDEPRSAVERWKTARLLQIELEEEEKQKEKD